MEDENWQKIKEKIMQDPRNKSYTERNIPPILQVNAQARVLIVGQAPGRKVEESLIPFHDKSGDRLMEWLGMTKDVFYSDQVAIMPMDFYYPGKGKTGDLPPRKFMSEYHQEILALMPDIQLTVLIGKYSIDYYLKDRKKKNLTETVRAYREYLPSYFPIVHPSPLNCRWLKANPWFEEEVVPALQERVANALHTK
ncbi:MAG: uracil-DNA glycosylase family protein [Lactimicrobium sp.]|uniref:uracil-DNA glycosylase family protein n=1 Tax=Lactimicrobium sp. TaxID=2563780 RepID=UPI002F35C179